MEEELPRSPPLAHDGLVYLDMPSLVPIDQAPPARLRAVRYMVRDEPPPLIYVSDMKQLPMISRQFLMTRPVLLQAIPLQQLPPDQVHAEQPIIVPLPPTRADSYLKVDEMAKSDGSLRPRAFHNHPVHPGNLPKPYICEVRCLSIVSACKYYFVIRIYTVETVNIQLTLVSHFPLSWNVTHKRGRCERFLGVYAYLPTY